MSRFFQSFEEEKQEVKKKSTEIVEKAQEKLSKRELKLKELTSKIVEVKEAGKNFEKLFKKFMNDVRKYTQYFENNEVPKEVYDFLCDSRIASSKAMNSIAQQFLEEFGEKEHLATVTVHSSSKKKDKIKEMTLESILEIADETKKEIELVKFVDSQYREDACIALFAIYNRTNNPVKMIDILAKMIANNFNKPSLDTFLGKIFEKVTSGETDRYYDILVGLQNSMESLRSEDTPVISVDAIRYRILQVEFLKLGKCPENDDPLFRLLYLTRTDQWCEAQTHYEKREYDLTDKTVVCVLVEFARLSAAHCDFQKAFTVYSKCSESGMADVSLEICALCVILNRRLIGNPHFQNFLELFKKFDSNTLCLPSKNSVMEVCRAFYLLNILDHSSASSIIESVVGFKAAEELRLSAEQMYTLIQSGSFNN